LFFKNSIKKTQKIANIIEVTKATITINALFGFILSFIYGTIALLMMVTL